MIHKDYTVGWICAVQTEYVVACELLDQEHPLLPNASPYDNNAYTLGSIGNHNVVIASLPKGKYGIASAATVAKDMLRSFESIRIGLMVGIGGGAPSEKHDIRLGDVVVGSPTGKTGGVIHYEFGKTIQDKKFESTGSLNSPPTVLLTALTKLSALHERRGNRIAELVSKMIAENQRLKAKYGNQGAENDRLYESSYTHLDAGRKCEISCSSSSPPLIKRLQRSLDPDDPVVHFGLIASADKLMKNATIRDSLIKEYDVLCFEMEAAGLMDNFPCIVIRGICDYSDTHKNDIWQGYAAATAAVYAKELLLTIPGSEVIKDPPAVEIIGPLLSDIGQDVKQLRIDLSHARQEEHLASLPRVNGAAFNSYNQQMEPQCLPLTRVDLRRQLMAWYDEPDSRCIFWLSGMPGTGKSTIARTFASDLDDKHCLGASFFFSKSEGNSHKAVKFFTSLAHQLATSKLANRHPALKQYICEAIARNPHIIKQSLSDQWRELIYEPLSKLKASLPTLAFVIDALDECENEKDIQQVIRLFGEGKSLRNVRLRVFITSRHSETLSLIFRVIDDAVHQHLILHSISPALVNNDISTFIAHEMEEIRKDFKDFKLSPGWPGKQNIQLLVLKASGLFIYAATACRFIRSSTAHPEHRLSIVLEGRATKQSPTHELNEMYNKVLKYSVIENCDDYEKNLLGEIFANIVGSIVILFDSLSAAGLATLLPVSLKEITRISRLFHTVLDASGSQDSPVRLIHPSFRDFLLDEEGCPDDQFRINSEKAHSKLTESCLQLMSKSLKRDICGLGMPGVLIPEVECRHRIADYLPEPVQYACCYWVDHLQRGKTSLRDDNGPVYMFLQNHFLHWLEALSLMGKFSEGVLMVIKLQNKLSSSSHPQLFAILQDAKRFVLHKRFIIEKAPLQVYTSALIFSPKMSIVRNRYWSQRPNWIKTFPSVEENWSGSLQTLEGHSDKVSTVVFSTDGQLLASSSYDHTIRVWDSNTGALQRTLQNFNRATAVTISHDNGRLAATSDDRIVRVWDIKTGELQSTHKRPQELVQPVTFLPNGVLLHTGPLCNTKTDSQQGTLVDNPTRLSARTLSPDCELLASTLEDYTIRVERVKVYDAETDTLQTRSILEGHSDVVRAMAFSPNNELLASASDDHTIRIWDIGIAAPRACSEASHSRRVGAVKFSPDGHLLASISDDYVIQIWDKISGALQSILKGHSSWVWPITFSPDGQLIACVSDDHTVWLWDTKTGALKCKYEGHSAWIRTVAFSSDGQLLVSASDDHTIRLSHIRTGVQNILEGHSKWVSTVVFSPNNQLLASASADCTARIWNAKTGILQCILEGHSNWVLAVAFSPDSQLLASASSDYAIRLWHAKTGYLHSIINGHSDPVGAVAFSPNGQFLASISYGHIVKLWNTQSNDLIQTFASGDASSKLLLRIDGSYLVHDHGSISFKDESVSHYSIDKTRSWITWNDHNVLWLPPEFRPTCHEVKSNVLAMGHYSGRVSIIEFDPDRKPISELCLKAWESSLDEEAVRLEENCFKPPEDVPPTLHADCTSNSHSSAYKPTAASTTSGMTSSEYVNAAECPKAYTSPAGESPEYIPSNTSPAGPSSHSPYQMNEPTNPSTTGSAGEMDKTPDQTEERTNRKQAVKACREHKYLIVKVTKIPHIMRADEFVFDDEKKRHRKTKKSDWARTTYDGNTAWAYKYRKVTYISFSRIT